MKITQDVQDYAATLNDPGGGWGERFGGRWRGGSRHGGDVTEVPRHGREVYIEAEAVKASNRRCERGRGGLGEGLTRRPLARAVARMERSAIRAPLTDYAALQAGCRWSIGGTILWEPKIIG
jgi:hypothetical protein